MPSSSLQLLLPKTGETRETYCRRLNDQGLEEMLIRKGLRLHFSMKIEEFGEFFDDYKDARLRHLTLLLQRQPNRTDYSLARKVSKNLGISQERAEYWVNTYRADCCRKK